MGVPEASSQFIQLRKSINAQKNEELPLIHAVGKLIELEGDQHDQSVEEEGNRRDDTSPILVDLHAEVFIPEYEDLSKEEILTRQLERFQTFLNSSIIAGHSQITFIHGVGEGTLRTLIINESRTFPQINSYHYADQSSFGTGATTFVIAN